MHDLLLVHRRFAVGVLSAWALIFVCGGAATASSAQSFSVEDASTSPAQTAPTPELAPKPVPQTEPLHSPSSTDEDEEAVTKARVETYGAPTHEELVRQVRSVSVTLGHFDRALGERLVIGRWMLAEESLEYLRTNEEMRAIQRVILRFESTGRMTMRMEYLESRVVAHRQWTLEGMYGPEVRVILRTQDQPAQRERLLFLHVDRFLMFSPQGEALIFERHQP